MSNIPSALGTNPNVYSTGFRQRYADLTGSLDYGRKPFTVRTSLAQLGVSLGSTFEEVKAAICRYITNEVCPQENASVGVIDYELGSNLVAFSVIRAFGSMPGIGNLQTALNIEQ